MKTLVGTVVLIMSLFSSVCSASTERTGTFEVAITITPVTKVAAGAQIWCHLSITGTDGYGDNYVDDVFVQAVLSGTVYKCSPVVNFGWENFVDSGNGGNTAGAYGIIEISLINSGAMASQFSGFAVQRHTLQPLDSVILPANGKTDVVPSVNINL